MSISSKEVLGILSIIIGAVGYGIYLRTIFKGTTKPHMFTWIVWTITELTAFFAQISHGAGPGAWVTAFTSMFCLTVAGLAMIQGEKNITRGDWISFGMALTGIVSWYLTKNPLGAVILASFNDIVACYPTIRKSFQKPWEENASLYGLASLRSFISLLALENVSLVTAFYPASLVTLNGAVFAILLWRRAALKRP